MLCSYNSSSPFAPHFLPRPLALRNPNYQYLLRLDVLLGVIIQLLEPVRDLFLRLAVLHVPYQVLQRSLPVAVLLVVAVHLEVVDDFVGDEVLVLELLVVDGAPALRAFL